MVKLDSRTQKGIGRNAKNCLICFALNLCVNTEKFSIIYCFFHQNICLVVPR